MARKMDYERKLIEDILKLTESLLVVAGGRPFNQALSFGGVERLSRRISHFLRFGSIHRDKVRVHLYIGDAITFETPFSSMARKVAFHT